MNVEEWIGACRPSSTEKSRLVSMLGSCLKKDGPTPTEARQMLHGIFRRHISILSMSSYPEHFGEILNLLLILTEAHSLNPDIWYDLMNAVTNFKSPGGAVSSRRTTIRDDIGDEHFEEVVTAFAIEQRHMRLEDVQEFWYLLAEHFERERPVVGLHGLYTKYKNYVKPLSRVFLMMGRLLTTLQVKEDRGGDADLCKLTSPTITMRGEFTTDLKDMRSIIQSVLNHLWRMMRRQFDPWICPMSHNQIGAGWIQQLAESQKPLLPWAPGDVPRAKIVCNTFANSAQYLHQAVPGEQLKLRTIKPLNSIRLL